MRGDKRTKQQRCIVRCVHVWRDTGTRQCGLLGEGFDLPELKTVLVRDASRLPTIQMAGRGLRKVAGKSHCNIIQSEEAAFQIEKLALPARSFRYMNGQWLSCLDDTQVIIETMENSLRLLEQRRVRLPYYISDPHRRKIEVTLMKRRTLYERGSNREFI